MSTSNLTLGLIVAALAIGCNRNPDDEESGDTVDDTGESDASDPDSESEDTSGDTSDDSGDSDTSDESDETDTPVPSDAPQGFAFCAAGGRVTGATHNGILCLGPLDVAGGYVEGSTHTWQAGPIYVLAP